MEGLLLNVINDNTNDISQFVFCTIKKIMESELNFKEKMYSVNKITHRKFPNKEYENIYNLKSDMINTLVSYFIELLSKQNKINKINTSENDNTSLMENFFNDIFIFDF